MKGAGCTTVLVLFLAHAALGAGDCIGDIIPGYPEAEPVYIRLSTNYFSDIKHVGGKYRVENGTIVVVACPGSESMINATDPDTKLEFEFGCNSFLATCINGSMYPFIVGKESSWFQFGQLRCEEVLVEDAITQINNNCRGGTWVDSGFYAHFRDLGELVTIRHTALGSCYNERTKSVLYSKHIWSSGASLGRSKSSWDSIFGDKYYLDDLYADQPVPKILTKGHLAPDADFQNLFLKKLTYYYHNSAPEWRAINSGIWKALEQLIRTTHKLAIIYTGTSDGQEKFASRQPDYFDNQNQLVRIPDFFWKLVFPIDSNGNFSTPFGYVACNKERVRNPSVMEILKNYPCAKGSLEGSYCFNGDGVYIIANIFPEASLLLNPEVYK